MYLLLNNPTLVTTAKVKDPSSYKIDKSISPVNAEQKVYFLRKAEGTSQPYDLFQVML